MPPSPTPLASYARSGLTLALSLLATVAIVACQPAVGAAGAGSAPAAAPLPMVQVAAVQQRAVKPQFAQVGRVEAAQRVEIRPRVGGPIEAVLFREGELVRAGQPLFRIDSRPFDVAVERARAELQLARARESLARSEGERAERLAVDQAISVEEVERRTAAHAEAAARSAAAQAALDAAALDREFTIIRAPVDGRIGRALVTAGNYVAAGAGQPLANLSATAPLHVYFDIGDAALIRQIATQRKSGQWQARVLDSQGGSVLATAPVDFIDNEMAGTTGTLRLRARLDTPPAGLVPGQFVRVQLAGTASDTLLVPEKAIGVDQGQRFVLVVQADQQVAYRPVQAGAAHGELRAVASGLQPGEQVIVSGLMKIRPGMKVQVQPAPAAAQAQASNPAKS
ncbi:efflux RND transporter periplasmic adaptor subunit [Ramlibacter sp. AN1133]|uniref:efflux RND transporter periplasmic adaptor subunit n=1 Tax=Ramlibacter sp. AN1133 TaxID=3133429 RepID=UPI0030BF9614